METMDQEPEVTDMKVRVRGDLVSQEVVDAINEQLAKGSPRSEEE
ncbi:hypothetical protein [Streptomyces longispororuber]